MMKKLALLLFITLIIISCNAYASEYDEGLLNSMKYAIENDSYNTGYQYFVITQKDGSTDSFIGIASTDPIKGYVSGSEYEYQVTGGISCIVTLINNGTDGACNFRLGGSQTVHTNFGHGQPILANHTMEDPTTNGIFFAENVSASSMNEYTINVGDHVKFLKASSTVSITVMVEQVMNPIMKLI